MKKSKEKTDLAVSDLVVLNKPVIKPYFDKDLEVIRFIELMLPDSIKYTMKAHRIYSSRCGRVLRFRVNFFKSEWKDGELCSTNHIAASRYVQINVNLDDNKFEMIDLTVG